jgi:Holliday junction resolvasome RuvABC endonuclease subunit
MMAVHITEELARELGILQGRGKKRRKPEPAPPPQFPITSDPVGRMIGLDPARLCGWAVRDGITLTCGTWDLSSPDRDTLLLKMRERVTVLLDAGPVLWLAYEKAAAGAKNFTTAMIHAELAGVIRVACKECDIRMMEIYPSTAKLQLTGHGNAKKPQMILAVKLLFGITAADDNAADAVAMIVAGEARLRKEAIESRVKAADKRHLFGH